MSAALAVPQDVRPFSGMRVAVLGLGRAGLPAARALVGYGAEVLAWDDGAAARDAADVPLADLASAPFRFDALLLSPGIPHRLPAPHPVAARAQAAGVPILTDAEFLFRAVRAAGSRARFAGITGTNGKSTTTALLAHLLAAGGVPVAAGGNLGPAALSLPILPDDGAYALEMSSYMLERLATLRFDVAALLNLSADHLDRHGDMAGYLCAKRHIFDRQQPSDVAILGQEDGWTRGVAAGLAARMVPISGSGPAPGGVWAEGAWLRDDAGTLADLSLCPALPGAHNAENAAAAAAAALALGVARDALSTALMGFAGLPHRQSLVAQIDGIRFIDDSKATNADAAARAMGCYRRFVWIAGGMGKTGGIEPLASLFPRVARAILIGRDAGAFAATLAAAGVPHDVAGTLDAAVPAALAAARLAGADVVLLSPAAASFDQFTGFEARGRRFAELVRACAEPAR
jgi:UDP-N-acetylmuramoylalanine--D-glutamate ligase